MPLLTLKDLTIVDPIYGEDDPDGILQNAVDKRKIDEVLSTAQRIKKKQSLRKNKAKIRLGRQRAKRRFASADRLKMRARRAARAVVLKKILKNRDKSDLSYAGRAAVEKQVAKRSRQIDMIARRLLPKVRKKEMTKNITKTKPEDKK
jgi:hypothetical protein